MKKVIIILLVAVVVLTAGAFGGRHLYRAARQARLMKHARVYLDKKDDRKAALCLQQVLRRDPKNIEACRLLAELGERTRMGPIALQYRSRIVELNPDSTDDRLALVQTALMFRDRLSATNALQGVSAEGKKTAAYHNIAGNVALAENQPAQAEAHFAEACRLQPTNPAPQLNLAVVRLSQTNQAAQAEARSSLKRLASDPANAAYRTQALRELVLDSARRQQTNEALTLVSELVVQTNCTFTDRLLRLGLLRSSKSDEFKPTLAALEKDASDSPAEVYDLARWKMFGAAAAVAQTPADSRAETLAASREEILVCVQWLEALPDLTRTNPTTFLLSAQCRSALGDWSGLQKALEAQHWGENAEMLRRAYLALALRRQNLVDSSKAQWDAALKSSNNQLQQLATLLQLANQWNFPGESEDILWTIFNRYPGEKWAAEILSRFLYGAGRSRPLMSLYSTQAKRSPSDLAARNNLAVLSMLLDAKEMKPHDLALEVYQKAGTNAAYASTYAFSLHLQDKNAEALKIMQAIPAKDLEDPAIAGYYAVILKASGDAEKAKTFLAITEKAAADKKTILLPEEKRLFDRVKAG